MTTLRIVETAPDIADRLDGDAAALLGDPALMRDAAALIRDLDKAIAHTVAVKGSIGLSPWAVSVLHEAIARQMRRGDG